MLAQPKTVEEHFKLIMTDGSYIDTANKKVNFNDLPDWFDEELFKKGQEYYQRYLLGFNASYLAGLIAVFLVPTIAKLLEYTKQSSVPCTAFRRYLQTTLHLFFIHTSDVMDSKSKFYKSVNVIRWKHSMNSKRAIDNGLTGISQRDMVLTQFGFVGYVLTHPEVMGLSDTTEERQAINHLWRVVGHLLGIPERLNLCRRNEYETTLLCNMLLDAVYIKNLKEPTKEFHILTIAAVKGIGSIDPLVDLDAFLSFFYEINGIKYEKKISAFSRFNYSFRKANFYVIGLPLIGDCVRIYWNLYLRGLYWLYQKFPIFGYLRYGKQGLKILLYPHGSF
ncbi:uncharacterized protein LOC100678840 [Nasonia vitripennis]|uniref:ER-bound oxygenase mpaB/mpaB'/Rubber oxygenase catalytic domain-containing protein n=1 Tax=Nasonia vitripennis TaxID=7425 RepID=A0A7M7TDZ6_NASVI|nr:uncharacterized protein LOC100678840 [Nasonia vitripennis]